MSNVHINHEPRIGFWDLILSILIKISFKRSLGFLLRIWSVVYLQRILIWKSMFEIRHVLGRFSSKISEIFYWGSFIHRHSLIIGLISTLGNHILPTDPLGYSIEFIPCLLPLISVKYLEAFALVFTKIGILKLKQVARCDIGDSKRTTETN